MALVLRGAAQVYTEGQSIAIDMTGPAALLQSLGLGRIGPVPLPVIVMLVAYGAAWLVMCQTAWGLRTYAVGSSARASRVAGVRVARHRAQVFHCRWRLLCPVLRTLVGVVFLATLANGLIILNISSFYQGIATGGVLLTALALDRLRTGPPED